VPGFLSVEGEICSPLWLATTSNQRAATTPCLLN
jgi:hypothetical protein